MNIQEAQSLYLSTADQKYLNELYRLLVALGRKLQRTNPGLPQDPDVVIDIAGGVCLRLLEKQQLIIKRPSSYMIQALKYYRPNGSVIEDLEDHQELEGPVYKQEPEQDICVKEILNECNIDTTTEIGALVEQTLLSRVKWTTVNKRLLSRDRKKYERQMEEVYYAIKNHLQSSGVLSTRRRLSWHKVLRRTPTPRSKRSREKGTLEQT